MLNLIRNTTLLFKLYIYDHKIFFGNFRILIILPAFLFNFCSFCKVNVIAIIKVWTKTQCKL